MENSACLNNFPNDLILEILSRLPVKSLFRFRCVSRSWYSLVSNPNFIKKHLDNSANNTNFKNHNFLLQTFKGNETKHCSVHSVQSHTDSDPPLKAVTFVDPPWMDKNDDVRIWGSCNGLICIGVGLTDVYLWNPAMKKSKKLPSSGMEFNGSHFSAYGLGYEEANDDYKVVMIHGSVTDHMYNDKVVKIYSSKKNSWEIFKNVTLPNGISTIFGAIFVNGKFNFQIIDFQHPSSAQMNHISVLDLEHGGKNLAPPEYGGANLWTLCEVNGRLSAFCENINTKQNDVWILREDNSWSKIMSIPYSSTENLRYYSYPMPFWVKTSSSANGEEMLMKSDEGFVFYNPKEDSFRRLETDFDDYHLVGIYVESLVFPYNDQSLNKYA